MFSNSEGSKKDSVRRDQIRDCRVGSRVILPGRCNDGGVQASVAGQSDSDGDSPAHETEGVICKSLKGEED